ncbi:DppC ABC-type dipeptide/oligopeptide/nickel transport systems, permease components [Burkholderiaceae bacterium]|jgi:peptide/nickel transport system permease protein|nr:ABC transporter permease [Burkholderiales bacterium]
MKDIVLRFTRNVPAVFGLGILICIIFAALLAPILYPQGPFEMVGKPFIEPFTESILGTDQLGRDLAAGILYGARITLQIGLLSTIIAIFVGIIIGGLSGYFGGWLDSFLMRITEIFQTIPFFLFAILLVAILRPTLGSVIFAIAIVSWPPMARLVRSEFISIRNREFIQACIVMGMNHWQIIFRHVLPNAISPIIVTGSLMVATAILIESGLSFLGLTDPNVMSWGYIIGSGRTVLRTAWWVCTVPGIAILMTVMAINLVGEGFNDALNPRLKNI